MVSRENADQSLDEMRLKCSGACRAVPHQDLHLLRSEVPIHRAILHEFDATATTGMLAISCVVGETKSSVKTFLYDSGIV
jgi:hypothetical protein